MWKQFLALCGIVSVVGGAAAVFGLQMTEPPIVLRDEYNLYVGRSAKGMVEHYQQQVWKYEDRLNELRTKQPNNSRSIGNVRKLLKRYQRDLEYWEKKLHEHGG
tara:strand:+ start:2175 stop:2486 length:312 start_codon:yes stop_codon:yes gene_type:complete